MSDTFNPLLARLALLGGAEEAVSGTMETISGPLANTAVYNARLEPIDFFAGNERSPQSLYDGTVRSPAGLQAGRLTFTTEYREGDQNLPMLTGCGYKLSGGIYTPTSDWALRKTWSFELQEYTKGGVDKVGRVKRLAGCAGNVTIEIVNGARLMFHWDWVGIWQAVTDITVRWTQSPLATLPFVVRGASSFLLGASVMPHTERVSVNAGNTVRIRPSATAATGIGHCYVGQRRPTVVLDPEARLVVHRDSHGQMLAATEQQLNIRLTSGAEGLSIVAPKAQIVQVDQGERAEVKLDALVLALNADAGDDELKISTSAI